MSSFLKSRLYPFSCGSLTLRMSIAPSILYVGTFLLTYVLSGKFQGLKMLNLRQYWRRFSVKMAEIGLALTSILLVVEMEVSHP